MKIVKNSLILLTTAFGISLIHLPDTLATPMTWSEEVTDPNNPNRRITRVIPGTARWANGTTINVFINQDPQQGGTRHNLIREGIERWTNELANRGITLNIQIGTPPQGTQNVVEVEWVAPGSLPADADGNPQDGIGEAVADVVTDAQGNQMMNGITEGTVRIESDTTGDDFLRNLGMHEFGHPLGLADEATQQGQPHNAMDHNVQTTGQQVFTARDLAELNTLYGNVQGQRPEANVQGNVRQQGGGFRYEYRVEWLSGPEIPMFQVDPPTGIFDISIPTGWRLFDPEDPLSLKDYMEDAFTVLSGVNFSEQTALTFLSTTDSLAADNPVGIFAFSSFSSPTDVIAYAMDDDFFVVPGPSNKISTPEPTSILSFLALGTLGAASILNRKLKFSKSNQKETTRAGLNQL